MLAWKYFQKFRKDTRRRDRIEKNAVYEGEENELCAATYANNLVKDKEGIKTRS